MINPVDSSFISFSYSLLLFLIDYIIHLHTCQICNNKLKEKSEDKVKDKKMEQVNFKVIHTQIKKIVKEFTTLEVEKIKHVTYYNDITVIKIEINKTTKHVGLE